MATVLAGNLHTPAPLVSTTDCQHSTVAQAAHRPASLPACGIDHAPARIAGKTPCRGRHLWKTAGISTGSNV
jgi:hypothetical protein